MQTRKSKEILCVHEIVGCERNIYSLYGRSWPDFCLTLLTQFVCMVVRSSAAMFMKFFENKKKINILPQLIAPQGAIVQMRSGCTHMPPHSCPHVRITHYRRRCCLLQTHTANKRHWRQMEYDWQSGFTTKSLKSTLYPLYFYFTLNERGRE